MPKCLRCKIDRADFVLSQWGECPACTPMKLVERVCGHGGCLRAPAWGSAWCSNHKPDLPYIPPPSSQLRTNWRDWITIPKCSERGCTLDAEAWGYCQVHQPQLILPLRERERAPSPESIPAGVTTTTATTTNKGTGSGSTASSTAAGKDTPDKNESASSSAPNPVSETASFSQTNLESGDATWLAHLDAVMESLPDTWPDHCSVWPDFEEEVDLAWPDSSGPKSSEGS